MNSNAGANIVILSFFGMLGWLSVGLKLTGFIDWSWWLVLAPFGAPSALVLGGLIVFMIVVAFAAIVAAISDR